MTDLARELRALPRPIWILSAGVFINRLGAFVWYFLTLFLIERGYGPGEAGLALAAFGAGTIPASLLGGRLTDSIGRRRTIALSMFAAAAAFVALSQARTVTSIVALVAVAGFASELYRPASAALIADLTPPGHRVTAYALFRLAFNAGIAAGGALAGVVATASISAVFLLDAASCLAFGIIALLALPRTGHAAPLARGRAASRAASPLADRGFARFLAACALVILVQLQQSSALPLHIEASGLSPTVLGVLLAVNGGLILLLELPLSSKLQNRPHGPLMALGGVTVGVGMAATGAAGTTTALLATVVVWSLGEIVFFPLASAHVADTAPAGMQGRYQGWFGAAWSLGITLGPPLGLVLYGADARLLWLACAAAGALAAVLLMTSSARTTQPVTACCAPCC